MTSIILLMGGLFIILGLVTRKYPELIAGFRRVKSEEARKILPEKIRILAILAGATIIVGGLISNYFGLDLLTLLFILVPPFAMVIRLQVLLMQTASTDKQKYRGPIWNICLMVGLLLLCMASAFWGYREADVEVIGDEVHVSGVYGGSFTLDNFDSIDLVDTLPAITHRNNGFALGKMRKGRFELEGIGDSYIFLHSYTGPYIYIKRKSGKPIFINYAELSKVNEVYNTLAKYVE